MNYLDINEKLEIDDLIKYKNDKIPLYVKVIQFHTNLKLIDCLISSKFNAYIPLAEFDINIKKYATHLDDIDYYPQICNNLLKYVDVYISEVDVEDDTNYAIYLSRKNRMIDVYNKLKYQDIIECTIKNITSCFIYVECQSGVSGRIFVREAVASFVPNLKYCGLKVGSNIHAKVIGYNDELYSRNWSYIQANFPKHQIGDIVRVRIRDCVKPNDYTKDDDQDYYVEIISSHFSGILNAKKNNDLKFNDEVNCIITSIKKNNKYNTYKKKRISRKRI